MIASPTAERSPCRTSNLIIIIIATTYTYTTDATRAEKRATFLCNNKRRPAAPTLATIAVVSEGYVTAHASLRPAPPSFLPFLPPIEVSGQPSRRDTAISSRGNLRETKERAGRLRREEEQPAMQSTWWWREVSRPAGPLAAVPSISQRATRIIGKAQRCNRRLLRLGTCIIYTHTATACSLKQDTRAEDNW